MSHQDLFELAAFGLLYLWAGVGVCLMVRDRHGPPPHWLFVPIALVGWPVFLLHDVAERL